MSNKRRPHKRTLGKYITTLITAVHTHDPDAMARLRRIAGSYTARIQLDDEIVLVRFDGSQLVTETCALNAPATGIGRTTRRTVLELLAARVEVSTALADGHIEVTGAPAAVSAMLQIVEILLDASPRTPAMQRTARGFTAISGTPVVSMASSAVAWYPEEIRQEELALLSELGLLPDPSQHPHTCRIG